MEPILEVKVVVPADYFSEDLAQIGKLSFVFSMDFKNLLRVDLVDELGSLNVSNLVLTFTFLTRYDVAEFDSKGHMRRTLWRAAPCIQL